MNIDDVEHLINPLNKYGFTRKHVAQALAKLSGEKNYTKLDRQAGEILKKAREAGRIKFIGGRTRSCYYYFVKPLVK